MTTPKIYLAGPDIFRKDVEKVARWQKRVCEENGLAPLHPMDNNLDLGGDPDVLAARIFHADVAQMLEADAICANMNEFLGADPDSGTCFEVGFFAGFNAALVAARLVRPHRPIYGYTDDDASYLARIERWRPKPKDPSSLDDWHFPRIRMHINLMMEVAMSSNGAFVTSGFEACVKLIAADWCAGKFEISGPAGSI